MSGGFAVELEQVFFVLCTLCEKRTRSVFLSEKELIMAIYKVQTVKNGKKVQVTVSVSRNGSTFRKRLEVDNDRGQIFTAGKHLAEWAVDVRENPTKKGVTQASLNLRAKEVIQ
jgi:hypothetical protein